MKKQAFNPYLPSWEYIPDGEPHVFGDRLYIFGSHDAFRGYVYCPNDYVGWSADVTDLTDWNYEGVTLRKEQDPRNTDGTMTLFAPDAVCGPDGRYYMYYIPNHSQVVSVAVCDTPAGAYEFYGFVHYEDGTLLGEKEGDDPQFDPAIYRENGRNYLYTGFCFAEDTTRKGPTVTVLDEDMLTIIKEPTVIAPTAFHATGTSFEGHAFFEAPSMRKRENKYYLIYSSIHNRELCYALGDSPEGPFEYGGVIIDSGDVGIDTYKASDLLTNLHCNNHGSIEEVNGQWYIFYHRPTNGNQFSRQSCAEKISFTSDGHIRQVEMTSCGLNDGPLLTGPEYTYHAYIACNLWNLYPDKQQDESQRPIVSQEGSDGDEVFGHVTNLVDGATVGFKYFDCRNVTKIDLTLIGYMDGCFEIRTNPNEEPVAVIPVSECNVWKTFTGDCVIPDGVHAIYITHRGGRIPTLGSFRLY